MAVAIVLSLSLTAAYYLAGVMLSNKKIKSAAIGELGQAAGAAIIMVAVLATIAFFETGQLSLDSVVSPSSIGTVCLQLANSNVVMLNSAGTINGADTLTNTVCSQIYSLSGPSGGADVGGAGTSAPSSSLTQRIDYGLFANYVIMANLTSQTADNLNSLYIFESWIGFMSRFKAVTRTCVPSCILALASMTSVSVSFTPLQGYEKLGTFTQPLEFEANLTFYILFIQLLVISFFLFAWPYLLAAGMILRATFFTRRLGGLLIAIGVVIVLIYPLMGVLEYSAFSNSRLSPIGSENLPVSATNLQGMALYERLPDGTSTIYGSKGINFFILPNAGEVIDYYGCMPSVPGKPRNLLAGEAAFGAAYLIPGVGIGTAFASSLGGLQGALPYVPPLETGAVGTCTADNALNTMLALVNLYGISFVTGIFMPLINVLVALAATISLSKLFGGDTDIMGLSKLI